MRWFELLGLIIFTTWEYWKEIYRCWAWDNRSWFMPRKLRWSARTHWWVYVMPRKWLWEWSANLPYKEINEEGREYLQRYFLREFMWRGKLYIAYLHHFVGDDPGRGGPHNHKWRAWSFVLVGWYWEHYRWCIRKIRWFNRITPDTFHLVELDKPSPFHTITCWTLFIHEAEEVMPHWGFWKDLDDPAHENAAVYAPYQYPEGVKSSGEKWWTTADCRPKEKQLEWYL